MTTIISLLICVFINVLAFWQGDKHYFLWFLAVIVNEYFGFSLAATGDVGSAVWAEGLAVVVLGGVCLGIALMQIGSRARVKR